MAHCGRDLAQRDIRADPMGAPLFAEPCEIEVSDMHLHMQPQSVSDYLCTDMFTNSCY